MSANPEALVNTLPQVEKDFTSSGLIPGVAICLIVAAMAMAIFKDKSGNEARVTTRAPAMTEYESQWHRNANTDIAKTLSANQVIGCEAMAYRQHKTMQGDFVVYCSDNARQWVAWVVHTAAQKVRGPFAADPLTPAP